MTFVDDFVPGEGEELAEQSPYPEAFGITFTPLVGGGILAFIGLAIAIYLGLTQLKPTWESIGELKGQIAQTKLDIKQKKQALEQTDELEAQLAEARRHKEQVLALLSNQQSLETLLIDLNSFIEQRQAQLTSYKPELEVVAVDDGSLGTALNGKIKRQSVKMELEGTFDQTQSVIRNFERLQSVLLVVKDFETQVLEEQVLFVDQNTILPSGQPKLKTKFRVDAILPIEQIEIDAEEASAEQES